MEDKLELEITPEVAAEAGPYLDHCNCLVATLLKKAGYNNPDAGSTSVYAEKEGKAVVFEIENGIPFFWYIQEPNKGGYTKEHEAFIRIRPDAIGKKVVLHQREE